MTKHILVVSYSQSGQLYAIKDSILEPLYGEETVQIHEKVIKPVEPFPFPWNFITFMDTFPESVYLDPCAIEPIKDEGIEYDLVIFTYQVWFLSPSLPATAFLKSEFAKRRLKNTPVITVIGCRNMWIMAQEKVKGMLEKLGAKLIDNIVLVDQGSSLATFITTPRWMMTGKKDRLWGIFPPAGVSPREIKNARRFGEAIKRGLKSGAKPDEPLCRGLGAVEVDVRLIKSEQIATKSFRIWGKMIRKLGKRGEMKRKPVVMLYVLFLLLIIVTVVPINMVVQMVLRTLNKEQFRRKKEQYEQPSGSGRERVKEFLDE